jgi:hypothetical protein
MYSLRMQYSKNNDDKMSLFIKTLMNSLYGKFGTRLETTEIKHEEEIDIKKLLVDIGNGLKVDIINGYYIFKKDMDENKIPAYCIPILSLYTTAYARIKLYDSIVKHKAVYVDTDSIITKHDIESSNKLGSLEFVEKIKTGVIVKPKMYRSNDNPKIKGLRKTTKEIFDEIVIEHKKGRYIKFMKFKETLRRTELIDGEKPYFNQPVTIEKSFDLEDDKRIWREKFSPYKMQISSPIILKAKSI